MSAADDAREELEAEVWRVLGVYSKHPLVHLVDGIISRAEAYATACAADAIEAVLDDSARQRRLSAAEASAAEHRDRLEQAAMSGTPLKVCDCPVQYGATYHQRETCTDPVVARLDWYGTLPAAETGGAS